MPSALQQSFRLPMTHEVSLVSLDTVGAEMGWHIDHVTEWAVEQWAFDLSYSSLRRKEIRVWIRSLRDSDAARTATPNEVIESVIGSPLMDRVRAASLESRWRVSGITLARLRRDEEIFGEQVNHSWWLTRSSLRAFLERRLIR